MKRWWIVTHVLVGKKVAGPYGSKRVAELFRQMRPDGDHLYTSTED